MTWAPTPTGVERRPRAQRLAPSLPEFSTTHSSQHLPLTRLKPGRHHATGQHGSLPGPPSSMALSPLPSAGQTWQFFPPSGAGAVPGRVGKPAKQGSRREPVVQGRPIPPPPSSPVPLSPHRAEAAASQNQPFYYSVGGLGPVEGSGAGGGMMPGSPGACGEDPGPILGGREEAASSHSSYPAPWH